MSEVKVPVTRRIFLFCQRKKIPVKQKHRMLYGRHSPTNPTQSHPTLFLAERNGDFGDYTFATGC